MACVVVVCILETHFVDLLNIMLKIMECILECSVKYKIQRFNSLMSLHMQLWRRRGVKGFFLSKIL